MLHGQLGIGDLNLGILQNFQFYKVSYRGLPISFHSKKRNCVIIMQIVLCYQKIQSVYLFAEPSDNLLNLFSSSLK